MSIAEITLPEIQPWPRDWRNEWSLPPNAYMASPNLMPDSTLFHCKTSFHPNVCHACKRGTKEAFHPMNEKLYKCGGCRLVTYCEKHQKPNWKYHKELCRAVTLFRKENPDSALKLDSPHNDKNSYDASLLHSFNAIKQIARQQGVDLDSFAPKSDYAATYFSQAHCDMCYTSLKHLTPCLRCSTVAYCAECLPSAPEKHENCDEYFLILSCYAEIGALQTPFCLSSKSVESPSRKPTSWSDYLARTDFGIKLTPPLIAMMTESLSLQLTILKALHDVYRDALLSMPSITITILGADGVELGPNPTETFKELLSWLPQCRKLTFKMIGPSLHIPIFGLKGGDAYKLETLESLDGRKAVIDQTRGLYHDAVAAANDKKTNLFVAQHALISSKEYSEDWEKTLVRIKKSSIPLLLTTFTKKEFESDLQTLVDVGFDISVFGANLLRGLRPFMNVGSGGVYYDNSFTILANGRIAS